jgi:phosphatidate cytidylyltransferase
LGTSAKPRLMPPIIYYTLSFAIVGGIGMALANRKATDDVSKQRWLKYFMYILITGIVIASIELNFFRWIAWTIVVLALAELVKVSLPQRKNRPGIIITAFILFFTLSAGFLLFAYEFSAAFLLYIYFQVLIFDAFCQVTGQLWGKTPLWPSISPAKTRGGLVGGWICCMIAAGLTNYRTDIPLAFPIYTGLIYGTLTAIFSFCGDMAASYYKRKMHVKDYSNWLPGQGGFLDRFDSLLCAGCFYYFYYILIFKQ